MTSEGGYFVWGPPGTGKTTVITGAVRDALARGRSVLLSSGVVAAKGADAVVRLQVDYREPDEQQYRDLWVLRFAADGRVEHFEEWACFPGQPYPVRAEETTIG